MFGKNNLELDLSGKVEHSFSILSLVFFRCNVYKDTERTRILFSIQYS